MSPTANGMQDSSKVVWFAFAGYPEIKRVKLTRTVDARPGHFMGMTLAAFVEVEGFRGMVCFNPGTPGHDNLEATVASAKRCVDYQRKKRGAS